MGPRIRPGVRQVFGSKRRIAAQNVALGRSELTGTFQDPNRNSCPNDPGCTAADAGRRFNARKGIAEVADDPLEKLCLLGTAQLREEGFGL